MKQASTFLSAICGITLFAIASVVPASADPRRYHEGAPNIILGNGPRRYFGVGPRQGRRYFGVEPGRYFGVGPGSYECYGYDCNW